LQTLSHVNIPLTNLSADKDAGICELTRKLAKGLVKQQQQLLLLLFAEQRRFQFNLVGSLDSAHLYQVLSLRLIQQSFPKNASQASGRVKLQDMIMIEVDT
jgi:hypothetical protein